MSKHNIRTKSARYESDSPQQTMDAAAAIIRNAPRSRQATVIALSGDLGAGKTQFAKGVARELGIDRTVASPTFLVMRSYETKKGPWERMFHLDCYRVDEAAELSALGWEEILANPRHIILLEWAQRVSQLLPPETVWVRFDIVSPTERSLIVETE